MGCESMGLKRQRPACGNDGKRKGNQVSGLRRRVPENVMNRLNPVVAFEIRLLSVRPARVSSYAPDYVVS
jgi:hypothetical protein